jgi:hypothetical protein
MNKNLFMSGMLITVFVLLAGVALATAPTTTTIPTQEWNGRYPWNLDLSTYFSDADGDPLTYSFARADTASDIIVSISGSIATFSFVDEDFTGDNLVTFTATDNETTPNSITSNQVKLLKEQPAYCDAGDGKKIDIGDIDFDDDDYKIGDSVSVDVEDVEATSEDLEDVNVEVCLFNINENAEIECWDADGSNDINEDDTEDYDLEFSIPNDKDIGEKDNYLLIVHVEADDESGDKQCLQKAEDITIERNNHDVMVESFSVSPSVVEAGETVQFNVKVENIGTKNEEDVYVVLRESALGIDYESNRFDLDDYKDSDNDRTLRFSATISSSAKVGDYVLEPIVYFDDGDETNSNKFANLKVVQSQTPDVNNGENVPTPASLSLSTDTQISASKNSVNLHLILTNGGNEDLDALLSFTPIGNWAGSISGQPINLHPGQNNLYFTVGLNNVQPGISSATVKVSPAGQSNFNEKQFTLNFDIQEGEKASNDSGSIFGTVFEGRSITFWVVAYVVLIVLGALFLRAVFFRRTA